MQPAPRPSSLSLDPPREPSRPEWRSTPPGGVARPPRAPLSVLYVLLAGLPWLICAMLPPLNHDVAGVLNFAQRMIAGERLYTDLIDVNPPLIFVLNLVPAAIGAYTPIGPVAALLMLVFALMSASLLLSWRLLTQLELPPLPRQVAMAAIAMTEICAGYDFAQREHLMLMAGMPYLVMAALRGEGRRAGGRLMLLVTVLAAVGFGIKPHFMAVPALVELWVLCCLGPRRWLADPVPWIMGGIWVLYLISLPLLFPAYFAHVVPLVWDYYVSLGGLNWWQVLFLDSLMPAWVMLVLLAPLAFWRGPPLARVVALAALGSFLSAWVQKKGWSYHVLPINLYGGLLAALLAAHWAGRVLAPSRAESAAPRMAVAAAVVLSFFHLLGSEAPYRQITWSWSRVGILTRELQDSALGERLLVLSPDVFPVYPALNYAEAQSTLRTMTLWLLQGVYQECPRNNARFREPWEMSRTEFFVYRTVAEDFARAPPAAVLVSDNAGIRWCGGRPFDLIAYFSRHPLFAETFSHYRQTGAFEGYRLYRREE
ncbi:hypothetical protein EOD42_09615 [Rhodovarius crocodyli]|uniref:Glycosyltransferase RgtA/B/C/D-like domain-containing protein n=1 Tax=Rhodovarius crocodyli TaxID=1979269 RepID=A0A437MGD7_9PROT|nr:hypothetical protein [Rhodovarius crocodyli]RVT96665.1 hypothetical protein EOD42_09615 [Rhodovarius crocodyli]